MKVSVPLVVITGRANVGKSTLFNRLSGKRISIVDSTPGVTRDVVESEIELEGRTVRLMDTGGIELTTSQGHILQQEAEKRAWMVLKDADCVLLVIDGKSDLTGLDQELAARLRKINRHLILVVNKRDGVTHEGIPSDLYTLGWERMVPVSAIHGDGIPALKQVIMECLKEKALPVSVSDPGHPFRVAIVGKPNVGKSTLFNTLLGEDRSIVSDIPGTTRDALESSLESHFGQYRLVDTAGLVRKTRIKEDISFYASVRTMEKI
ncbi:MAG: GTPase, partial [Atribacterota bacterium]